MERLTAIAMAVTLLALSAGCAFGATITISGVGNATQIDQNNPTTNYGGLATSGNYQVTTMDYYVGPGWEVVNSLWAFNLTPYVGLFGSTVTSATLDLSGYLSWGGSPVMDVYQVTQAWTPTGATWNTSNGTTPWTTPGGTYTTQGSTQYTSTMNTTEAGSDTINVTSIAQAWANGAPNNGVLINETTASAAAVVYDANTSWTTSDWPVLTINYTPVPEPGSLLALFTGLAGLAGLARRKRS